jgi:uncharacterized protein with HEPN domain
MKELFMKKDPEILLAHILESIKEIEKNIKNISSEKFFKTTQIQDAVMRRLEIIGEASRNLPTPFKNDNPQIPWAKMAAMRNILIHEYFGVDLNLVLQVINKDLPNIKKQIGKILA